MEIIEAVWEKRNLGVSCAECTVTKNDSAEMVIKALAEQTAQYIVVKVAAGNADVMLSLQSNGFRFIESLFTVEYDLKGGITVPKLFKGMISDLSYHYADESEVEQILEQICSGAVFSSDRIALDPHFSREAAGQRYAYWIRDVLSSGKAFLIVTDYKGVGIGFHVIVEKGRVCNPILGGLFPQYLDSGYGPLNPYTCFACACDRQKYKVVTHVSSNNFQMLKINQLYNCKITDVTNTFIKHQ